MLINMADFKHLELKIIEPTFDSPLIDLVVELEHLRRKTLSGSTHPEIFFQLKNIFHTLESIGSARIEGNNTTISEFIETKIENRPIANENIQEIRNIELAMQYVDEYVKERGVTLDLIKDIHSKIVDKLSPPPKGEGDSTPGTYRDCKVYIKGAKHIPPETNFQVKEYMENLIDFVNNDDPPKYDLLKVALAHHRFMWIHPFSNGNGRTGRLFTYAMLLKQGFNVNIGRILNPTAVFCFDRNLYNTNLSLADSGNYKDVEKWCTYVLEGLKNEIDKIDNLSDYSYLKDKILVPAIKYSLEMKYINRQESKILNKAIELQSFQNSDIQEIFPKKLSPAISRMIRELKQKNMLQSEKNNYRKYYINFANNFLIRGIIKMLAKESFIPLKE